MLEVVVAAEVGAKRFAVVELGGCPNKPEGTAGVELTFLAVPNSPLGVPDDGLAAAAAEV